MVYSLLLLAHVALLGASLLILRWVLGFTEARNMCFKAATTPPPKEPGAPSSAGERRGRGPGLGRVNHRA